MAKSSTQVKSDLTLFIHFVTESRQTSADELANATSSLMRNCPTARPAVLSLYRSVFEEYCLHFVQTSAGNPTAARRGRYLSLISDSSAASAKAEGRDVRRVSSDRRPSAESASTDLKETPASPPLSSDEVADEEDPDRSQCLNSFIEQLASSIFSLIDSESANIRKNIADWALDTLCQMASHFEPIKKRLFSCAGLDSDAADFPAAVSIKEQIKYWQSCSVIDILIRIILKSMKREMYDLKDVLLRLMNYKPEAGIQPHTEWICCSLITSAQEMTEISSCIQFLLESSVTESAKEAIFSFLSTQNPESVISCSKANIPFLLRLCSKSKALLDVLSKQITRAHVDVLQLSQMENLSVTGNQQLKNDMIACLLSSENSFDLLLTACQVSVHKDSNEYLRTQSLALLDAIVDEVHDCVYIGKGGRVSLFLDQLKLHFEEIISAACFTSGQRLKRIQMKLIKLLGIHFGMDFTIPLLHEMFNEFAPQQAFDIHSLSSTRPNSELTSLFQSLKLAFGRQMTDVCNKLLTVDRRKSHAFWVNLLSFVVAGDEAFEVDLELATEHLTDFLEMDLYDLHIGEHSRIESMIIVLEVICLSIDRNASLAKRLNHNLCVSLVINYVNLVDRLEQSREKSEAAEELKQLTVAIDTSQRIMKSLSRSGSGSTNQQMLTRTFMDCILSWNKELEEENRHREKSVVDVRLKTENLKYGGAAFKFRKIPLNPSKDFFSWKNRPDQQPLLSRSQSRHVLLQGIKCCIKQMDLFSHLLVEAVTPDVMFNDMIWPDEDFLKVTIERDLLICKKYESHCILWDLTELVAEHGLLRNCSVLIRALMAVQLTNWAAGTSSEVPDPHSLQATQRLISLLAKSHLIPELPFKFIPEVLPHLNSWEIFCVSNDLWKLIRDSSMNQGFNFPLKPYLDRLRVIMSHKCPGETFVKIFKGVQ